MLGSLGENPVEEEIKPIEVSETKEAISENSVNNKVLFYGLDKELKPNCSITETLERTIKPISTDAKEITDANFNDFKKNIIKIITEYDGGDKEQNQRIDHTIISWLCNSEQGEKALNSVLKGLFSGLKTAPSGGKGQIMTQLTRILLENNKFFSKINDLKVKNPDLSDDIKYFEDNVSNFYTKTSSDKTNGEVLATNQQKINDFESEIQLTKNNQRNLADFKNEIKGTVMASNQTIE